MREVVMPQDHHLLLPTFSFSPASKAGERSWACASSRLRATRPTSCLSSQTRESLSSVRAWSRSSPSSCSPRSISCSLPLTFHSLSPFCSFTSSVFFSFLWFFRLFLLLHLLPGRLPSPSLLLAVSPSLFRKRP